MRSRDVSSYRSNKRSKRGNKLSKRISKRRVKRSNKRSNKRLNKRSNRRLNRKSFKRVSKRMRNNRKSYRRRGGAPPLDAEWHTSVRLRCLGFEELDFDPKTNEPLKSRIGLSEKVHYLIMVVTQNLSSNSTEVYFIRRRWSDIKLFIASIDDHFYSERKSHKHLYERYAASRTEKYADAILGKEHRLIEFSGEVSRKVSAFFSAAKDDDDDDDVYDKPPQRQGILDSYLLALSNYNNRNDPHKQIGARVVNEVGMWKKDLVIFHGILPPEETRDLDLSIKVNPGPVDRHPKNRVQELLERYKQENPTQAEPTSEAEKN